MQQSSGTALTKAPLTGTDDFVDLVLNRSYQDKTLGAKTFIESHDKVVLITRPRRDGKSTFLSTLDCFLSTHPDKTDDKNKQLFRGLKISEDAAFCAKYQNQYPVIFITLKDLQTSLFSDFLDKFKLLIQTIYLKHRYLLHSDLLDADDKKQFTCFTDGRQVNKSQLENSLLLLTSLLSKHYKKPVYILIDEYDSAINYVFNLLLTAKDNKAEIEKYLNDLTTFFKNFLVLP